MNVTMAKCNICGAINTANDQTWVRVAGVMQGNSLQPIIAWQRSTPGQIRPAGIPPQQLILDFCPACAVKTTVSALPALYTPKSATPTSQTSNK